MRFVLPGSLAVGALVALVPGTLAARSPSPDRTVAPGRETPVRVSAGSPFAGCPPPSRDDPAPRGEVEPVVAANPTRPGNAVAVWTQDRFRGLVAGVSSDGGATWERRVIPGFTRCTGGSSDFDYVDDAWLSFGPGGVLHLSAKVMDEEQVISGRLAARSTDGGRNWSDPVPLVVESRSRSVNYSGGAITADPRRPGRVYSVVSKFVEPDPDRGDRAFRGAVFVNRSRDGGNSWGPARKIFDAGNGRLVTGHQVVVAPDGTLTAYGRARLGENQGVPAGVLPYPLGVAAGSLRVHRALSCTASARRRR